MIIPNLFSFPNFRIGRVSGPNPRRTLQFCARTATRLVTKPSNDYTWLRDDIVEMGPVYVKLGQIASVRTDLLSKPLTDALSTLQTDVPSEPFEVVREVIEGSFPGYCLEDLYEDFDPTPIAAASIAQVHSARLGCYRVAVKVQRPNIRELFEEELTVIKTFVSMLSMIKSREAMEAEVLIKDLERTLLQETDFLIEKENMRVFRESLKSFPRFRVPRVVSKLSSSKVLTMEFVSSERITNYRSPQLAQYLMRSIVNMIVNDGLLHCDPHPGNIGVTNDDTIVLYDFGMTARLSTSMRQHMRQICILLFNRNTYELSDQLLSNRFIIAESEALSIDTCSPKEQYVIFRLCDYIYEYISLLDVKLFIRRIIDDPTIDPKRLPFRLNDDLFYLFKSMAVLEGVCKTIDHQFNYNTIMIEMIFEMMDLDMIISKVKNDLDNISNNTTNTIPTSTAPVSSSTQDAPTLSVSLMFTMVVYVLFLSN